MRILHVIHDFLPRHYAGSELYVLHLARQQRSAHDVAVLCAEYDPLRPHGALCERQHEGLAVLELVNNWDFGSFEETYDSGVVRGAIARALAKGRPDVVHIHNLFNLSMAVPTVAWDAGIPCVATLHDYTLLCPSGGQRVHLSERHLCWDIDPARCGRCFGESPWFAQMRAHEAFRSGRPPHEKEIRQRMERAGEAVRLMRSVVAPSRSLAREVGRLGLPVERLEVSDYGFPEMADLEREPSVGPLRIGFVGTIAWHKGVHVLLDAARRLPRGSFEMRLHGDPKVAPAYVAELRRQSEGLPVRFVGAFRHIAKGAIYGGLDVVVVPSLWPENSPLVIHEAFQAGVPVVGARRGGIEELLDEGRGLLYDAGSPDQLAVILAQLAQDRALLNRFAGPWRVKSITEDAREWEGRYRRAQRELAQLRV